MTHGARLRPWHTVLAGPAWRRRAVGATLALALCACGGGGAGGAVVLPATEVAAAAPGTWVVLGSSTAAGTGASPGQGWVALLALRAAALPAEPVTLVNLARPGAVTHQALPTAAMPPAGRPAPDPAINIDRALEHAPRLVILAFPSNDAVAGFPAAETAINLARLRELVQAHAATAVLLSSQPRDRLTPAQRAALDETDRQSAATFGDCFVDVRGALADPVGRIAPAYAAGDGVHLNDSGHRMIAERLWAVLETGRCVRLRTP